MESSDAGTIAAIVAGLGIFLLFFFAFFVFFIICHWKIFTKAGQEGWKSLIPLYIRLCAIANYETANYLVVVFLYPFCKYLFWHQTHTWLVQSFW
jgi:hypothetical protein